jgi:hypothetical protein
MKASFCRASSSAPHAPLLTPIWSLVDNVATAIWQTLIDRRLVRNNTSPINPQGAGPRPLLLN